MSPPAGLGTRETFRRQHVLTVALNSMQVIPSVLPSRVTLGVSKPDDISSEVTSARSQRNNDGVKEEEEEEEEEKVPALTSHSLMTLSVPPVASRSEGELNLTALMPCS